MSENDYENPEPEAYMCKNCESVYTIKTYNTRLSKNGEEDAECECCGSNELIGITEIPLLSTGDEDFSDLKPYQKFRILYKHTHCDDHYYEDDFGREHHSLSCDTRLCHTDIYHKTNAFQETANAINKLDEMNADYPPYDSYKIVLIYDLLTRKVYNVNYFELQEDEVRQDGI